jgi:hypothetical protein
MSHPSIARTLDTQPEDLLFKPDRPRRIDQFIDFFGAETRAAGDAGGESLLHMTDDEDRD